MKQAIGVFDSGIGGGGKIHAESFHELNGVLFAEIEVQDNLNAHDQGDADDYNRHDPVAQTFSDKVRNAVLNGGVRGMAHVPFTRM